MRLLVVVCFILASGFVCGQINTRLETFRDCDPFITCANCYRYRYKTSFRTIDGTCNNLRKKIQGAARTEVARLLPALYADGDGTPRSFPGTSSYKSVPTAHEVARSIFRVHKSNTKNKHNLSVLYMTFGQFLDHDLSLSPHADCDITDCSKLDVYKYPCFPIKFDRHTSRCTGFGRSRAVCQTRQRTRGQINVLSSYVDTSNVYSNDFKLYQKLRKYDGSGELKITKDGLLPIDKPASDKSCKNKAGCSLVGDERGDENVALSAMHTIWVRHHNYIAKQLKKLNSRWSERRLFETARKINGAIFQHIVFHEYVPLLADLHPYTRYDRRVDASIVSAFSTAAFRYGHSLVPNSWEMLNKNYDRVQAPVPLQNTFFDTTIIRKNGIESLVYGLIGNWSQEVDDGFSDGVARRLFVPPGHSTYRDLTALNIQRGRDHGLPTYGAYRKLCKLPPVKTYRDLKRLNIMSPKMIKRLAKIFKDPNDIDLFAAGISENHVKGKIIGQIFHCIIKDQFTRLRDGDRFYYERPGVFTRYQLREIKKMSMAKVLCNTLHGIVSVQKEAFKTQPYVKRSVCDHLPNINFRAWAYRPYHVYGK